MRRRVRESGRVRGSGRVRERIRRRVREIVRVEEGECQSEREGTEVRKM